jgi:hypothetical protein
MVEVPRSREIVRRLADTERVPQVLVRIGDSADIAEDAEPTPRRPLDEVLRFDTDSEF